MPYYSDLSALPNEVALTAAFARPGYLYECLQPCLGRQKNAENGQPDGSREAAADQMAWAGR